MSAAKQIPERAMTLPVDPAALPGNHAESPERPLP